jgi:hypothetical protein
MDFSRFFPPEISDWLMRYGLFAVSVVVAVLLLVLLLRPLVLWYTGRGEELERLKRIDESTRKALFELEMLNETLSIPVKKAAQKAKAAERAQAESEPLVVTQQTKEGFLEALEKTRRTLRDNPDQE